MPTTPPFSRAFSTWLAILILAIALPLPETSPAAGAESLATGSPSPDFKSFIPRCEIVPLANHAVSFQIAGEERLRWHFGPNYPRPFFFPLTGPAGGWLTRMGHPGASNHDHHRSVWFAHHDVAGVNFWGDTTHAVIRQREWLAYRDGDDEAVMACSLGWFDGSDRELMQQELIAALIPLDHGEYALELQSTFSPPQGQDAVALGKTNFGFLAVRVAKSMSEFFGGGTLTSSEGAQHEPAIFGEKARWVDYSGPVATGTGESRQAAVQGITYFDHPENPRYPSCWHVRQDGWMGASFCLEEGFAVTAQSPLRLRYLLHAHRDGCQPASAELVHQAFARRPAFEVVKGQTTHGQWEVRRIAPQAPAGSPSGS